MGNLKEIRVKIASVKSTQKITRAMELVAASKMKKSHDRMSASKPYAEKLLDVVTHLSTANPEYQHHYLKKREVKKVGVIVVSTDRGLCGGLNTNLFKRVIEAAKGWGESSVDLKLCLVGNKACSFFKSVGGQVVASVSGLGDKPSLDKLIGSVGVMFDMYARGEIDALYVYSNEFVNTMVQKPMGRQLLPLDVQSVGERDALSDKRLKGKYSWDYLYEPDAKSLLDLLFSRYIESLVYQSVVENSACEQAARMVAMKSATDNAGRLIKELQLVYNKARQAAITQEISEIVGGAAAV